MPVDIAEDLGAVLGDGRAEPVDLGLVPLECLPGAVMRDEDNFLGGAGDILLKVTLKVFQCFSRVSQAGVAIGIIGLNIGRSQIELNEVDIVPVP